MGCTPCARRRKAAEKARLKALEDGKRAKAAAIGAALSVTEAVGKAIGIHGEVEDGRDTGGGDLPVDQYRQGPG